MKVKERSYIAIDLKSFYASVECQERGLDPLTTNLVVADESRTDKTICLAVSPSLKAHGIPGRARLFEVQQRVREVNLQRENAFRNKSFSGKSAYANELETHPDWEVDFIIAPPRMALYIEYSTRICAIYQRFIAPEDIHVYSIDEVFIDVTNYLATYRMTPHQLARTMIREVLQETGITATAGIGTNLYLAKVAMDIVAKHIPADADGVRIAELDEKSYRQQLWDHRPLTAFWRVGKGIARKLEAFGMYTMGDVARCSLLQEEWLYRLFGANAQLLIDHAWGWEPCTMEAIKRYRPTSNSLSSGQVLSEPYSVPKARVVVQEMIDDIALNLVAKRLVTDQLVLTISYDSTSLNNLDIRARYNGALTRDYYGREVPKHAHGTVNMPSPTASCKLLSKALLDLYDTITNRDLLVRRISISTNHVVAAMASRQPQAVQLDLFRQSEEQIEELTKEKDQLRKEQALQETLLKIKKSFGKNAILKGLNLQEGATAIQRNQQIGGHKA